MRQCLRLLSAGALLAPASLLAHEAHSRLANWLPLPLPHARLLPGLLLLLAVLLLAIVGLVGFVLQRIRHRAQADEGHRSQRIQIGSARARLTGPHSAAGEQPPCPRRPFSTARISIAC